MQLLGPPDLHVHHEILDLFREREGQGNGLQRGRMNIKNQEGTLNRRQPFRTSALLAIGLLSVAVGLVSSRFDGLMFYLLTSGSIVLGILIASAILDMILTVLAWMCQREQQHRPTVAQVSYATFQERTSASREMAIVK
jgi:hypothetical protein